ncbi:uncharacterized protein LOC108115454 isoform X2 [Drosophila eugracilis]|nr:uncharacterized protein LOC108115454 isoform X2 [Drosophila eugracilis]XP_017082382.2 uncharacterized protein LOC108115454 isoform X2 [Drosophila eugracilis]
MLMPVREYNKHIAKIPNCKMRQRPTLRATFASLLLLLLHLVQALEPAAAAAAPASGAAGSGGAASGAAGSTSSGNAGGGGSLSSGPPTLIANLTEQGSPGVYNSTMG